LISLLIMLIASINYNLSLGYALSFMMTGLFCSTLLATYQNISQLQLKNIRGTTGIAGEPLDFRITLHSDTKTRPAIDITHEKACRRYHVAEKTDVDAMIKLQAVERGWLALGRLTISTGYPLGLWYAWSYYHTDSRALIYPAAESSAPKPPALTSTNPNGNHLANSGEISGVREYRAGDPINTIAWKSSARGAGLQVRESTAEMILPEQHIDWQDTRSLPDIEHRISRLTAWVRDAEKDQCRYSLGLPDRTLALGRGEQQLERALKLLALYGHPDEDRDDDGTLI